ncbi:ATP-grasp domain-containing protein [Acanthopleuribacter pedis]|uniref:ATP-grasp domain-containing protein n=1 Tax=Acanthopleuribacter pedis TaxID=442870 RepID=A0A8J7U722_9BACT|nr:ATP-grasp domain-containing protein [Acanthopleuribacter pedis]MBO1320961.1 ATP-grasp domain-containing protein [Acanthopleuribacter pedis]
MVNILVIQPGFPNEVPYFVRGLARQGAAVYGIGDQPPQAIPEPARAALRDYLQVPNLWKREAVIPALRQWRPDLKIHRIECFWEAAMELAADLREAFKIPGLSPKKTRGFRDKHVMRQLLNQAGVRNPRQAKAESYAQIEQALAHTGYPAIVKPVAGAGSADTYRLNSPEDFEKVKPALKKIQSVVVEEFVTGTEYTFDTISVNGRILFANVERYVPTMLLARSQEHISPMTISLRDLSAPHFQEARKMCETALDTLGLERGFAHMEWFHTDKGEVVFGEIAARPPGGDAGMLMNYTCDFDVYNAYAEAMVHGRINQNIERKYNVAVIFKRAKGNGRISRIEGLVPFRQKWGAHILKEDLLPVGAKRRNWRQTLLSDGYIMLRHPDLATTLEIAGDVADHITLYA